MLAAVWRKPESRQAEMYKATDGPTVKNGSLENQHTEPERDQHDLDRFVLTDILALGNQLKSLDREVVVKSTVNAVHDRLGFGFVTLSLVQEDDPTRVRVVAWAGIESTAWERIALTSLPLIDLHATTGMHQMGNCYLVCAPGTTSALSTPQHREPWHEGDQLFVPLTTGTHVRSEEHSRSNDESGPRDELLGYLTVDQPDDGLRPTEDTLEVLEIFANQAAIAIQNANLYASIDRALDHRVAELATLHQIDTALNVKLDFDYVMNVTLEWAMRITHALAGTLALTSRDGKSLRIVAHSGYPSEMDPYWSTSWPSDEGLIGRVMRTGEPQMISDASMDLDMPASGQDREGQMAAEERESHYPAGFPPFDSSRTERLGSPSSPQASSWDPNAPHSLHEHAMQAHGTGAYLRSGTLAHLAVPIKREGQISGVITLESDQPGGFTIDDRAFLMRFADHAAIVIENVKMVAETGRRVAELSALRQISLDLTSSLNLSAVLDSVAQNTMALTQADGTVIYLYDEHEDALFFGSGLSKQGQEQRPPIPIPEDILTAAVARRGTPIVIHDTGDSRSEDPDPDLYTHWQIGAIASIPLQKAGHVLGVFDVLFRQPHFFSPDELRVLNLLADQAAIAIQNAQLFLDVQRANEAKSEFVSTVSHELKIPMTSIQGYARLITLGAAGPVTPQQHEFANVILRNVERMATLVSDLLDLSRIESGRIQIAPRPVDLSKLVHDAARSLQDQLNSRGHTLEIAIPPGLPEIEADPARIIQVWVNLLSNACKYTPPGGQIAIWAREQHMQVPATLASAGGESQGGASREDSRSREDNRSDQGDQDKALLIRPGESEALGRGWLLCAIQDNGVGIQTQDQERIFEPFYRVNRPETSSEQGTGLGLSITRSIIELHGGHIWVESAPDQGSTFFFTLPTV